MISSCALYLFLLIPMILFQINIGSNWGLTEDQNMLFASSNDAKNITKDKDAIKNNYNLNFSLMMEVIKK
ncbi:hypothetical protein [uncultured Methanobacterium sp.]|uniref:hypothetical protein n=1 Tax=uncultured Methanobacterium sp. TaxID=176306 RepID=UPI002AA68335|nr:hypothetical protein [uncultured Methanobacterium sp.]